MSVLLSIETSTATSSVAVHENGILLASQHIHVQKSHSAFLIPSIKHLFEACGLPMSSIDAVAVSKGPGSYTGLRIGTATAKGLCYGLGAKLIAINTLEAMTYGISPFLPSTSLLCPMIDARRMEVYCLLSDQQGRIMRQTHSLIVDENAFSDISKERQIVFFGNGATKCREVLEHLPNAFFIDDIHPDARHIGTLAWQQFQMGNFENLDAFEPFYLKDFMVKKPSITKMG